MAAEVLSWWAVLTGLGLGAWPLARRLLGRIPDQGWSFSRAIGLLGFGYLAWVGGTVGVIPNARPALVAAALVAAAGLWLADTFEGWRALRNLPTGYLAFSEAVFGGGFLGWAAVRSLFPEIRHTEQPMDLALLNAAFRAETFPPPDPWLAGHPVSYYYFGYLVMGLISKVAGTPTAVGYNLALAALFGLTAQGAFGLAYALARLNGASERVGRFAGLLGPVCLLLVGNWVVGLELLRSYGLPVGWAGIKDLAGPGPVLTSPEAGWWWWRSTRVIDTLGPDGQTSLDYTITEFPLFSFILGDLHPHVMALPFGLTAVALALELFLAGPGASRLLQVGAGWVAGGLGFINTWDLPTFGVLMAAGRVLAPVDEDWRRRLWGGLGTVTVTVLAAIGLYFPFYLTLQSQVQGVGLVGPIATRPLHLVLFWGPLLAPTVCWLVLEARPSAAALIPLVPVGAWLGAAVRSGIVSAERFSGMLAQVLLSGAAAAVSLGEVKRPGARFAGLLAFAGGLLILGVELFYIRDIFGTRMNTVFKLYYQAWVLFATGAAAAVYMLLTSRLGRILAGLAVAALVPGLLYGPLAVWSRSLERTGPPTLDGLAWLRLTQPDEAAAVDWLWASVQGSPVIVEAVGPSYSEYGRVSARTGLPTVLGWPGHEVQWRGSDRPFRGREQDVDAIYSVRDLARLKELLSRYRVRYVYFGRLEQTRYGPEAGEWLTRQLKPVFRAGEVTIFEVPQG
jgi:YYY domain-containing protein